MTDRATGAAAALAATVVHGGDGSADHAVAICELPDGTRCYASADDPDSIEVVSTGAWVAEKAQLEPAVDGTNRLRW